MTDYRAKIDADLQDAHKQLEGLHSEIGTSADHVNGKRVYISYFVGVNEGNTRRSVRQLYNHVNEKRVNTEKSLQIAVT